MHFITRMTQHARAQQKKGSSNHKRKSVAVKILIQPPRRLQLRKTNAVGFCFFSLRFPQFFFLNLKPYILNNPNNPVPGAENQVPDAKHHSTQWRYQAPRTKHLDTKRLVPRTKYLVPSSRHLTWYVAPYTHSHLELSYGGPVCRNAAAW